MRHELVEVSLRFCIVGTGRCGSTLLRNMLDLSPEVFVFPETHWIPKMWERYGGTAVPPAELVDVVQRTRHVTGDPVTALDVDRVLALFGAAERVTVREFCDRLGRSMAADRDKSSWADKTPDYGPFLATLQHLWPECRFIHLIRHGADTARSMSTHPGYRWLAGADELWWYPAAFNGYFDGVELRQTTARDYLSLWHRRMTRIRDELGRLRRDTFLEVRFEDLVDAPAQVFGELTAFLELESGEWIGEALGLIDRGRISSRASNAELAALDAADRELLADLGYGSPVEG